MTAPPDEAGGTPGAPAYATTSDTGPPPALMAFYWHFMRQTEGRYITMFITGLGVALIDTHIGYSVVPWKQRQGYATRALARLMLEAPVQRLAYVHITTEPADRASQRVILGNSGELVEEFISLPELGGMAEMRFRIVL